MYFPVFKKSLWRHVGSNVAKGSSRDGARSLDCGLQSGSAPRARRGRSSAGPGAVAAASTGTKDTASTSTSVHRAWLGPNRARDPPSSKAKVISTQAPQFRQFAMISDSLDLANMSMREEAALATNWIKDRPEGLKLQNLAWATITRPAIRNYPKNTTADAQHALKT